MTERYLDAMIQGEMTTSFEGLVRLLARNLYSRDDAFIRELIQNAHDSVVKRAHQRADSPAGIIDIRIDRVARLITFEDNGAGMTIEELQKYLSTIGRSGTGEYRNELIDGDVSSAQKLIGQFGIGILSAFVVGKRLEVETRSIDPDSRGLRWVNDGSKQYSIEECEREDPGTRVVIHLDEGKLHVADVDAMKKAVRRYADFIPERIYVNDEQCNTMDAPWHRFHGSGKERQLAYEAFIDKRFPDMAIETIPIDIDEEYKVQGVIYISDRRLPDVSSGVLDVYQARMFVASQDRTLLPEWAKFVRGVIDSPHLTPTASRDAIQQDRAHDAIQAILGKIIIDRLRHLAATDRDRFERIMEWHHFHMKGMAVRFDDFFDATADLMLFECNELEPPSDGMPRQERNRLISIKEYIERQRLSRQEDKDRVVIYYFKEQGAARQYYRLCRAKGLLVLSACAIFEESFLKKYEKQHESEVVLRRIDIAEGSDIFEPLSDEERRVFLDLEFHMSTWLRHSIPTQETAVTTERFEPKDIPAVLTQTRDHEVHEQLERLSEHASLLGHFKQIGDRALKLQSQRAKPIHLHLNASNPLIQKLAGGDLANENVRLIVSGVYNNSLLYSMHALSPDAKEVVYDQFNRTLSELLDQQEQLIELQATLSAQAEALEGDDSSAPRLEKTPHVSVFVMMPYAKKYDVLEEALKMALEMPPYCCQVFLARDSTIFAELLPNVLAHLQRAHGFIAEITEENPNVMFELGIVSSDRDDRPKILFKLQNHKEAPADVRHWLNLQYELPRDSPEAIAACAEQLREKLSTYRQFTKMFESVSERYLSPLFLSQLGARLQETEAARISKNFPTIERLLAATDEEVENQAGLGRGFGRVVKLEVEAAIESQKF